MPPLVFGPWVVSGWSFVSCRGYREDSGRVRSGFTRYTECRENGVPRSAPSLSPGPRTGQGMPADFSGVGTESPCGQPLGRLIFRASPLLPGQHRNPLTETGSARTRLGFRHHGDALVGAPGLAPGSSTCSVVLCFLSYAPVRLAGIEPATFSPPVRRPASGPQPGSAGDNQESPTPFVPGRRDRFRGSRACRAVVHHTPGTGENTAPTVLLARVVGVEPTRTGLQETGGRESLVRPHAPDWFLPRLREELPCSLLYCFIRDTQVVREIKRSVPSGKVQDRSARPDETDSPVAAPLDLVEREGIEPSQADPFTRTPTSGSYLPPW